MRGRADRLDATLREHGVRLTGPRKTILDAAVRMRGHFTADELLERMRSQGVPASKATLYRTLTLLVEKGLLEPREFERGSLRYEVATSAEEHHDHMICTGCGTVHEFVEQEIERLQAEACVKFGFRMLGHSHRIFGLCSRCVARGRAAESTSSSAITASPPPPPGRRGPRRARPA
jgi:Fur family ferric uptake transcriptional regulator